MKPERAMRLAVALALSFALILAAASACKSDAKPEATVTSTSSSVQPTATSKIPTQSAGATSAPASGTEEVTGIVGNVNTATRTIQIDRRSGASVSKISVLPSTTIRSADGATVALSGIRSSDRIVAKGSLNDRRDALVATEITVSQAVPGAAPG